MLQLKFSIVRKKGIDEAITLAFTENIVIISAYQRVVRLSAESPIMNSAVVITSSLYSRLHVQLGMAGGL